MPNTFELIASSTVGAGGASFIDFTSIPSTYTDLVIYLSARGAGSAAVTYVSARLNGSSSAIYSHVELYAESSTPASAKDSSQTYIYTLGHIPANTATASTFGNTEIYIPNYAGTSNKSLSAAGVAENNSGSNGAWTVSMTAGGAALTSEITSIRLVVGSNGSTNFMQYSTAYLYGVKNA